MTRSKTMSRRYKKRRLRRSYWLSAGIAILFIIGVWFYRQVFVSEAAAVWFETKATSSALISLPKDDAPHQAKMEWWYYNGHLTTETGKSYSFHDTVFLVNGLMSVMVNHFSFSDYQTGRHYIDQHRTGGNLSSGTSNRFDFIADDWNMSGGNGIDKLQVSTSEVGFNLDLISMQPPVFQGKDGIISMDSAGSSYYYSRPRMAITGSVKINGRTEAVKGIAWFDHQWGDFSTLQLSWDWFSLQLDNDSDIMIYQLRDKSNRPVLYTGSITQNGNTEMLSSSDFSISNGKKWTSSKTGFSYPIEWQIKIPKKNIDVTTKSMLSDSEFDARLTTYLVYWEGAVKVTGTHTGQGFMELSGYENSKK
jgi:predicted secreted hydrolase